MRSALDLIRSAIWPDDYVAVAALFRSYAASLDVDLGYQGFASELASLPGKYQPPHGALLVADGERGLVGCVALRPLPIAGCCEMKRLYVLRQARGIGLGKALAAAIVAEAARLGYDEIRLDSLPSMSGAIQLYRDMGFKPMEPYYPTPIAGTVFLRLRLNPPASMQTSRA